MIKATILIKDLSKTPEQFAAMSYTERIQHDVSVLYGERSSVGSIVTRASVEAVEQFRTARPDAYRALVEQVMNSLEIRGIHAPADASMAGPSSLATRS
jgi:hypothetical protein